LVFVGSSRSHFRPHSKTWADQNINDERNEKIEEDRYNVEHEECIRAGIDEDDNGRKDLMQKRRKRKSTMDRRRKGRIRRTIRR
jgi:hypothetical protein